MFLLTVAGIFILFAETIIYWFSSDPIINAYGSDCLRIISYGYGLFAAGMVLTQAFNGAGDTHTPTYINLFCFWLVQIPLAWLLATVAGIGPRGVFISITVAESLVAVVACWQFCKGRWKLKAV